MYLFRNLNVNLTAYLMWVTNQSKINFLNFFLRGKNAKQAKINMIYGLPEFLRNVYYLHYLPDNFIIVISFTGCF